MLEKVKKVSNPLTIIAIFAALAEVASSVVLVSLTESVQLIFVWFVMAFPFMLVLAFFVVLYKKPNNLYAPSDFKDEKNYLSVIDTGGTFSFKTEEKRTILDSDETLHPSSTDAYAAYVVAREIAGKHELAEGDRERALENLKTIIRLGVQGHVDPNLLFNSSSVASTLDLDHEALILSTLCAEIDPKPSHTMRKLRLENVFGQAYVYKDNALHEEDVQPITVRERAWSHALDVIKDNPVVQCELIYSELHNIAVRNREMGYIEQAIAAIESLAKGGRLPSYAFVTLAGFYAMIGAEDWRDKFNKAFEEAARQLSKESPASSWYQHTIREAVQWASRLGQEEKAKELLSRAGLNAG